MVYFFYSECRKLNAGMYLQIISNPTFLINILTFCISHQSCFIGQRQLLESPEPNAHDRQEKEDNMKSKRDHTTFLFLKNLYLKACPAVSVHFIYSTLSHCHTYMQGRLESVFYYLVTLNHSVTKEGWNATGNLCHNCYSALECGCIT